MLPATRPPGLKGFAFEQLVERPAPARPERRPNNDRPGEPDTGVDIAAFIPGEEQRLGAVMFQVKGGTLTGHALREPSTSFPRTCSRPERASACWSMTR